MNIVVHNLLAMNADRQFNIVNKKKAKSTEKLSSGYKINRAADDAAGLSISEKMRRQIRGLHKAVENIQDGISLCQVADGALNEVHDILQRMNELSVKAGNDTNSQTDRAFIQTEIDALTKEIDRIANQTTFNEEIYPLLGGINLVSSGSWHWELPDEIGESTIACTVNFANPYQMKVLWHQDAKNWAICKNGTFGTGAATLDGVKFNWSWDRSGDSLSLNDLHIEADGRIFFYSTAPSSAGDKKRLIVYRGNGIMKGRIGDALERIQNLTDAEWIYAKKVNDSDNKEVKDSLWIHMSTEPGVGMFIDLVNATAKGIGVDNLDVSSMKNAGKAIDSIKGALEKVSRYRTVFGSQQNRLEHAMLINENIVENTTAAESRIRDADIATEMVKFSNLSILQQAGQAVLAHGQQDRQYILSLLQ